MNRSFRHLRRLAGVAFLALLFGISLFIQDGSLFDGWVTPARAASLGPEGEESMQPECKPGITRSNPNEAYTVNADGTVTDIRTGLVWDRCAWGQSGADCSGGAASSHTWADALNVAATANAQSHKGHTDWRLPNIKELRSLVEVCRENPTINDVIFPNTPDGAFWSSTPYARSGWHDGAWFIVFYDFSYGPSIDGGSIRPNFRDATYRVRLVRGGR